VSLLRTYGVFRAPPLSPPAPFPSSPRCPPPRLSPCSLLSAVVSPFFCVKGVLPLLISWFERDELRVSQGGSLFRFSPLPIYLSLSGLKHFTLFVLVLITFCFFFRPTQPFWPSTSLTPSIRSLHPLARTFIPPVSSSCIPAACLLMAFSCSPPARTSSST